MAVCLECVGSIYVYQVNMTIEQMKENTPNYFKFNIVYKQVDWIQLLDFHVKADISSTSRTKSHKHKFPQFCTII